MKLERDDKRLTFLGLDWADKASGLCDVIRDAWWCIDPDKGLIFFKGSPQCNASEALAKRMGKGLYPWATVAKVPLVIYRISPKDYC